MTLEEALMRAYPNFPFGVQNGLVSAQGLLFRQRRFGGEFPKLLAEAKERGCWDEERLIQFQIDRARRFLVHAGDSSCFWRRRFLSAGFDPHSFKAPEDIRNAPILEKDDLRRRASEIASSSSDLGRLFRVHTSGTTGSPISVAFTWHDTRARMAHLYRMLSLFGVSPFSRSVRFSGRTLFGMRNGKKYYWRFNWPMRQMLMSSYDLHPSNLEAYVDQLSKFRPVLIDGYPSAIYILSRFINKKGYGGAVKPQAVMTTAETLEEYQRIEIEAAFGGAAVINQYASSEGAPFITQDTKGEMVVNVDTGLFEYVKPGTSMLARPGEVAELLVTSFSTHAYPLIRYRIGDTVLLPKVPRLSSDWNMPVVERVLGRQEDILFTRERGYVPSLNKVFAKVPSSVKEAQIVQKGLEKILIKVVPEESEDFKMSDLDGSVKELKARVGAVEVEVEVVTRLPRGSNGKLCAVVGLREVSP